MLRELIQSWSRDPWFTAESSNNTLEEADDPFNAYDQNALLASILQLQGIFGQDDFINMDGDHSPYYDEFTFVPNNDTYLTETVEPSNLINDTNGCLYTDITQPTLNEPASILERRSSSCSSLSSFDSSKCFDSSEENISLGTSGQQPLSSCEDNLKQLQYQEKQENCRTNQLQSRKQLEEMILEKITNELDPERLPGILSIINAVQVVDPEEEIEEVEVDLERLDYDQLERILAYVDACLLEKEGGPLVDLSSFVVRQHTLPMLDRQPVDDLPPKRQKKSNNRVFRKQSAMDGGHIVDGSSYSQLSSTHGPLSMSALTDLKESAEIFKKSNNRKRRKTKKAKTKNEKKKHKPSMKNYKKPSKRRTTICKRKMSEDLAESSSAETDEDSEGKTEGGCGIIIFGDEKMDFAVTQNQTIVHNENRQPATSRQPIQAAAAAVKQNENSVFVSTVDKFENEEFIDIMS
ncbi:hypothetical protein BDF20DRAFT_844579 [Mycotypha africana]|uniref:uncharacterized protein n=1 Tax=Mycotypha africana TaxID=64632 RepID=UPI00230157F0|nr:uncharacterized protein BDF20DRAFT_844579 [Mycotypha africana]KAI8991421.1 hypothetical protein BDF20DRAFT_844579 [Mycotypha africana]